MNQQPYHHHADSLLDGVEEERGEDWDMDAVRQHCQVGFRELEGRAVLLKELPHTLQKEQEHWGL